MVIIRKSENDNRIYDTLTLQNGLQVVIVQDIEGEKSACSLSVGVGSLHDPEEYCGLAHFLEHMLFLGTEKYPDSAEYRDYLTKNGGNSNAYTAELETNYHFEVSHEGLLGALDRFSQFFICPLMSPELTEREMQAVNSEHTKNISNDGWRENRLLKHLSHPLSEFNRFSTGNLDTLNKPFIRDQLISFYHKYYSANIMKLCVVSRMSVEEIRKQVEQMFVLIPNKQIEIPKLKVHGYPKEQLGRIIKVVPSNDKYKIQIMFVLPPMNSHYKTTPDRYLSHLIGHEGKNSLFSLLQDEGFCYSLSAGGYDRMDMFNLFFITIELTNKGFHNYQNVLQATFQYIHLLNQTPIQKWVFDELQQMNKVEFKFINKSKPESCATFISSALHSYPVEDVLIHNYDLCCFDPSLIKQTLSHLNPSNMNILLYNKEFSSSTDLIEPYYNIQYSINSLDSSLISLLKNPKFQPSKSLKCLDLPIPNTFIANEFQLIPPNSFHQYPQMINETPMSQLFYQSDSKFKVPKSYVFIKIFTNDNNYGQDSKASIFSVLWKDIVNKYLNETKYLAQMALLDCNILMAPNGFHFTFKGLNHKLFPFILYYIKQMLTLDISTQKEEFDLSLERIKKSYNNYTKNQSYHIAMHFNEKIMKSLDNHTFLELREEAKNYSFDEFEKMYEKWLKQILMTMFVIGNSSEEEARQLQKDIEQIMNDKKVMQKHEVGQNRVTKLNKKECYYFEYLHEDIEQQNSCIMRSYQMKKSIDLETTMKVKMAVQLLRSAAFEQLRTKEQLGYTVFTYNTDYRGTDMFNFIIQSDVQPPHYLAQRIDAFLDQHFNIIKDITQQEFEQHKQSIITELTEKDYSLVEQAQRLWREISTYQFKYDRNQQSIDIIQSLNKQQVIDFIQSTFFTSFRFIESMVISHKHLKSNTEIKDQRKLKYHFFKQINSIDQFKRTMHSIPDYQSLI